MNDDNDSYAPRVGDRWSRHRPHEVLELDPRGKTYTRRRPKDQPEAEDYLEYLCAGRLSVSIVHNDEGYSVQLMSKRYPGEMTAFFGYEPLPTLLEAIRLVESISWMRHTISGHAIKTEKADCWVNR